MIQGKDYIGVGVCGLLIRENKCLFLKRNKHPEKDFFGLVGGRIEFNETAKDALIREAKEEIGIDIKIFNFLGYVDQIIVDPNTHWVTLNFLIGLKNKNDEPLNVEKDKHSMLKWFDLDTIIRNFDEITITGKHALCEYKKIKLTERMFNIESQTD